MLLPDPVLATWSFNAASDSQSLVIPDGCRDIIVHSPPSGPVRWFTSPLASRPHQIRVRRGDSFKGWRLKPGARVNEARLRTALAAQADTPAIDPDLFDEIVVLKPDVSEALELIGDGPGSLAGFARRLGVSERTLQRLLLAETARPAGFWRRLARARKAARAAAQGLPLKTVAAEHGFADQAHMTREIRSWLGVTPSKLRAQPLQAELLAEDGYF